MSDVGHGQFHEGWCMCQVDDGGGGFDGQDAGAAGDAGHDDDDDDNDGGVDFGLLMADDASQSQSQFITSQPMNEMGDDYLLTGDNLLAIPRKVIHPSACVSCSSQGCRGGVSYPGPHSVVVALRSLGGEAACRGPHE